jgi:uncharacterized membrane protein YfcA
VEDLVIPLWALAALFVAVSFAYSTVGLGGGSAYAALMAIFGISHVVFPSITLSLNLLVTFLGSVAFIRQGHARPRLILPFLVTSVPMSFIGGTLQIPSTPFYCILLVSLTCVAARLYLWDKATLRLNLGRTGQLVLSMAVGAVLGLVSGMVGIGGGIYLVPLIIILGWGSQKEAAACGAIFIWVNSLAGLTARLQFQPVNILDFLPLMVAVLIGGSLGSYLGSTRLSPRIMEKWLGGIVLLAILLLARKILAV